MAHWSNCATNNGPALPVGPCDCGNDAPSVVIPFRTKKLTGFIPEDTAPSETNPDSGDCS